MQDISVFSRMERVSKTAVIAELFDAGNSRASPRSKRRYSMAVVEVYILRDVRECDRGIREAHESWVKKLSCEATLRVREFEVECSIRNGEKRG